MQDFELLGQFYLGSPYDLQTRKRLPGPIMYDAKDLVTHAVCVGMTGSGKTGLCINLLEEAAIDGIPAIVIDPKGDLGNLLLTFPDLLAKDFRPWINEDDAARKGLTPDQFAQQQADFWKKGLSDWGEDGNRIRLLKEKADFSIYTPGSNAGLPVAILKAFTAPNAAVLEDGELLQDQIRTTATSVLGLIGIDADPVQSREHILISTLLNQSWKAGKDLDLGGLIQQIQVPPIERIGVLDVDSFFPQKERFTLAMKLNNLLAAPGFENWLNGEPLDIGRLLYTPQGKPRVSIFSIAHLADAERMFFVSLLLNQLLGWTRAQTGTTSLRALFYMDEIFGYFPPVQNPPSKLPLLTLLKQARAYGVGIVLATQNPVDLDYKGLANAGTWFIGRLQTERDKMRVLDGLEGAAAGQTAGFDRNRMEQILAGLGNRVFLMNNVKENAPQVFESRWALSYLRGPITRSQIKQLMDPKRPAASAPVAPKAAPAVAPAAQASATIQSATSAAQGPVGADPAGAKPSPAEAFTPREAQKVQPMIAGDIRQCFVPIRSVQPAGAKLLYRPAAVGVATVYFSDVKSGLHAQDKACLIAPFGKGAALLDWQSATDDAVAEADLADASEEEAVFAPLPARAAQGKIYDDFKKSLAETLYRTKTMQLMRSPGTGELSHPGESERDFRIRIGQVLREQRDEEVAKIREKYAAREASLHDQIRRAELARDAQSRQASTAKLQTVISFGATILGAFLGRKTVSAGTIGRATTTARGVTRSMKESGDVGEAEGRIDVLQQRLDELAAEIKVQTDQIAARLDASTEQFESIDMRPKKSDIEVQYVGLAWAPYWCTGSGEISAWET